MTTETKTQDKPKSSGNEYEMFRDGIAATVYTTAVKQRDASTSYNWSIGRIITACAEAHGLDVKNTPENFKLIVKFEIEKLRKKVESGYDELSRSKEDFVLKDGQMKGRLTNTYLKFITLETQLTEARKIYTRLGHKLTDETLSQEKRSAIFKRMRSYTVVIDHLEAEIKRQNELKKTAAAS